ncbi:DUF3943 domain-containing protein [Caenimonas aquaedulcis]|uniref:DUF3943 domain-containing protein n=1 Tax=Caenimonas aquaedulcis TaxID=2793270 RepID=A0A931H214_9BURK|nr:DUF3943 domain-containing protein [Caenimonas aquaedulcis]MBG9387159.1 DUF3943 domain-containing protein [Caenimonas aquaedulcis]
MNNSCVPSFLRAMAALLCFATGVCAAQTAPPETKDDTPPAPGYTVPALEIFGFDFLLNRYNHRFSGVTDYDVSLDSIRRNLHSSWVVDADPFKVNQLGHPYQGSMYHGFGRSAGLDFWPAMGLTFVGSAGWEIAGEQTRPSRNDQVASGIGGSFLGEALYRMANLLLEHGGGVSPFWRETGAAIISPSNGFNRLVYGKNLGAIFDSRQAPYYSRLQVGAMGTAQNRSGLSSLLHRNELQANFALDYGMPGKPGYQYRRPFDYFAFEATATTAGNFESVLTRGLLAGRDYEVGKDYRGVWGAYGTYDYVSPQTFRISTTAVSLGTTGEWRASDRIAVQGTVLAGVGYAAVGALNGVAEDYHYGVSPQALAALRIIHGDSYSFDLTGREYFVNKAQSGPGGHDNIVRVDAAFTARVKGPHAVTFKYLWNRRDATSTALGSRTQTRGTFGIFYTLLGHDGFGRADWR